MPIYKSQGIGKKRTQKNHRQWKPKKVVFRLCQETKRRGKRFKVCIEGVIQNFTSFNNF